MGLIGPPDDHPERNCFGARKRELVDRAIDLQDVPSIIQVLKDSEKTLFGYGTLGLVRELQKVLVANGTPKDIYEATKFIPKGRRDYSALVDAILDDVQVCLDFARMFPGKHVERLAKRVANGGTREQIQAFLQIDDLSDAARTLLEKAKREHSLERKPPERWPDRGMER